LLPAVNLAVLTTLLDLAEDDDELFLEDDELELDELLPQPANANAEMATTDAPVITDLNFIFPTPNLFVWKFTLILTLITGIVNKIYKNIRTKCNNHNNGDALVFFYYNAKIPLEHNVINYAF